MDVKAEARKWVKAQQAAGVTVTKTMLNAKIVDLQEDYTPEKNVEKAIEYAEQSGDITGAANLRAMQKGPEQFGSSLRKTGVAQLPMGERYNFMGKPMGETGAQVLEASFPRTTQAMASGNDLAPFSAMGDVSSSLGRGIESGIQAGMGNADFLQRMGQVDTPEIGSSIMRDPTLPFAGMGGALYGALSKTASPIMKAGGLGATGVATQAPVSMYSGMERESRGGEFGGGELGAELAISGAMGAAGPVVSKALIKAGDIAKKTLGAMSGKSVELLETVGTKELKQGAKEIFQSKENITPDKTLESIKNYGEKAEGIVEEVVDYLDGFDDLYIKENEIIGEAIQGMGEIDLMPVIKELDKIKFSNLPIDMQTAYGNTGIPKGFKTGSKRYDNVLQNVDNVIDDITGFGMLDETSSVVPTSTKSGMATQSRTPTQIMRGEFPQGNGGRSVSDIMKGNFPNEKLNQSFQKVNPNFSGDARTSSEALSGFYPKKDMGRTTRPADQVLKLRRKIDETINFNKSGLDPKYANSLDAISKKARTVLKEQLEKAAINTGNPEYIKAMKSFHELLTVRDRVNKKILSKDGSQDKVKNFLISLGNPDKLDNKILARNLEKILGKDLMEESQLLRLAKEYKNGLSVFTDINTGKSGYWQSGLEGAQRVGAKILGSPKFGAAPLTAGIGAGQEAIKSGGAGKLAGQYRSPGIQFLTGGNNE